MKKTIEVNKNALEVLGKYFDVFVNEVGEIIIVKNLNIFINGNFKNDGDLKTKVIYYLSRYPNDYAVKKYIREAFFNACNEILEKDLSYDDWNLIYRYIGNGINKDLAKSFIDSNCDMSLLGSTNLF